MSEHLEQLMDEHGEYCLRVAYLYVKDWSAAEEIVQDVYLSYYRKQDQFEYRSSLKTYLVKITVNKCHDYIRSWKNKKTILLQMINIGASNVTPESELIRKTEKNNITKKLLKLPIKYREVLILYYYREYKIIEIADLLHCSENTVKTRLQRAKKLLQGQLTEYKWEELLNE